MLPNLLIIGAMKSGTTTLVADLEKAFSAFIPVEKEPDYLHLYYGDVARCRNKYKVLYRNSKSNQLRIDASTMYSMVPWFRDVSKYARDVLGDHLKIIYIIRSPFERIVSHINHDLRSGRQRNVGSVFNVTQDSRFHQITCYFNQYKYWSSVFGEDAIYVINFDEYKSNKLKILSELGIFLNIPIQQIDHISENALNKAEDAKIIKTGVVKKFISSRLYREKVKPYLSIKVIGFFKTFFLTNSRSAQISINQITVEGIDSLMKDYESMLEVINKRRAKYLEEG